MEKTIVLSVLVENSVGVLNRVAGLFSRRGYSIDSLTVGSTQNPAFSRMTIISTGEEDSLEQLRKQLKKLVDVVDVEELATESSVCRELVLVKVQAGPGGRQQVLAIADIFRAKIVDVADTSMIVELTGNESKLEAFLRLLDKFKLLQVARTGITGLARGTKEG